MLTATLVHTATHPGANIFDSTLRLFRNVLGQAGIETFIFMNQTDPNDPNNGSLVIDGSALQGGGSVPASIAEFTASVISHHTNNPLVISNENKRRGVAALVTGAVLAYNGEQV